jgi:hypothetical protein
VLTFTPNQTVVFEYKRRTESGLTYRIGEVIEDRPNHVLIRETVTPGHDQYRLFHKSAMTNVLVD